MREALRGKGSGIFELLFLFVLGLLGRPPMPSERGPSSPRGGEAEKGASCRGLHKLDRLAAGGNSSPS